MNRHHLSAACVVFVVAGVLAPSTVVAQEMRGCGTRPPVATAKASGDAPALARAVPLPRLGDSDVGWEVCVDVQDPRSLDVELEVFDADPTLTSTGEPVCISSNPGSVKRCRMASTRVTRDASTLWVRVVPTATIGATSFDLHVDTLQGPLIGNTGLYASDVELNADRTPSSTGVFLPSVYPLTDVRSYQRAHRVPFTASRLGVTLTTTRGAGLLRLGVYSGGGAANFPASLISASAMAASASSLYAVVPPSVRDGYVVVTLDGRIAEPTEYQLSIREYPSGWTEAVAPGYVYKVALDHDRYRALSTFARCRPAGISLVIVRECTEGTRPGDAYNLLREIVWGMPESAEYWTGDPSEPFVTFLGIDQLSTTLLIERTGKDFADVRQTVLRSSGPIWAVYIEDDLAQFETTATVVFTRDEELEQHMLEPPGSREVLRVSPGARVVRVGMKRFDADRLPINAVMEFSREGPTYPRRSWTRTYRVLDRSKVALSLGLLITARDVAVDRHEIVLIDRELRQPGRESEIVHVRDKRPAFATAILSWPTVRAKCAEERGPWWAPCRGWFLIPNLAFGIGLPMQGKKAYLAGFNWPVSGLDAVQVTAGIVGLRQQKLRRDIVADVPLPRDANIDDYTTVEWDANGVVGLTIDIGAIARRFR